MGKNVNSKVVDLKRLKVLAPVTETPYCEVPSCTARAIGRTADEVPTRCRKHGGGSCCNIKACRNAVAGKVFDADALGDLGLRCAKHNAEFLCVATSCKEPSGVITSSWDSYGPPGPRCMTHSSQVRNVNDLPDTADRSGDRSDGGVDVVEKWVEEKRREGKGTQLVSDGGVDVVEKRVEEKGRE